MLRLSRFKDQIYKFFQLMIDYDMTIDVAYKGNVYRVQVTDLKQRVPTRRSSPRRKQIVDIKAAKCQKCNKLTINGICMNANH